MVDGVTASDPRNLGLTPLDPRPVFEAFAGFLTGAESGGQYHAANRTPTPEAQAQTIHLRVDDRFLDRYQCPPVRAAARHVPRLSQCVELADYSPRQTALKRLVADRRRLLWVER